MLELEFLEDMIKDETLGIIDPALSTCMKDQSRKDASAGNQKKSAPQETSKLAKASHTPSRQWG